MYLYTSTSYIPIRIWVELFIYFSSIPLARIIEERSIGNASLKTCLKYSVSNSCVSSIKAELDENVKRDDT